MNHYLSLIIRQPSDNLGYFANVTSRWARYWEKIVLISKLCDYYDYFVGFTSVSVFFNIIDVPKFFIKIIQMFPGFISPKSAPLNGFNSFTTKVPIIEKPVH